MMLFLMMILDISMVKLCMEAILQITGIEEPVRLI